MKESREKRHVPRATKGWAVVVLWAVVAGCASGRGGPPLGGVAMLERLRYRPATPQDAPGPVAASKEKAQPSGREGSSGPAGLVARAVMGGLVQVDGFEAVLLLGGLDNLNELPARGEPLTPEEAAQLYEVLLGKPVTLAGFGPRLVASYLLREVMEGEEEPGREELLERVKRFRGLAVLRPDGYLAWALTGETQQRVAPVEWKEGAFRARGFEVGRFYSGRNGMAFFEVDEELRESRQGGVLAEVYDDADVLSRVMEGAEEAVVELAVAMGRLVSHPLRSMAELEQLPTAVVALLKNSPEYLERFRRMTRGEQLRVLSKLGTTLLCTYGTAASTARTVGATGRGLEVVSVPALRLTAEGALAVERVAVPVGRVVTALRGGPGAALILHRANDAARGGQPAAPEGPGQWGPAHEVMSRRAARYQEQISGHAASEAYWVGGKDMKSGGVKLDGFEEGVLLEAKGPGYANKFTDNLAPKRWFKDSGAKQLVEQAQRQLRAIPGVPIRWHVAEEKAAAAIRKLLEDAKVKGIEVVHTPALQ
ncbi:Tox-REase-5 domain-containing protein [Hyalangium gracile]|uniref:Tox-REase-5 domain-containing protein n=1 Tax=Hyalangium gracile TaxID=394092 RepID=UPI001CCA1656|nr:Tox-REase-5 domain-containing protein [Hyalangium gracile]